jgi:hypothetical protein
MLKKVLLAGAALVIATPAFAGPSEGDWEIVFTNMGAGLRTDGDDTVLGASVRAGKFFWGSNHEFGFGASAAYVDGGDEIIGLGGFWRHNWATPQSQKWWYAGIDLDIRDVTNDAGDNIWLRPHFGHKWMLSDDISFDVNVGLDIDADETDNGPYADVQWGITVFFD